MKILCMVLLISLQTGAKDVSRSCSASVLVLQDLEKETSVPSPNNDYAAVLHVHSEDDNHGTLQVRSRATLLREFELHDLSGGVFVNWSPDSKAFYVMWSNGGMIGGYAVRTFRVSGDLVREVPTSTAAEEDFASKHPCEARGHNVYAIQWLNGSERILLGLQVYPTGDCRREAGRYVGYAVRVEDGKIISRYTEKQLGSRWPDGCPSAIYPTGFWDSADLEKAKEALIRKKNSGSKVSPPAGRR